jgi:hypothetical protein
MVWHAMAWARSTLRYDRSECKQIAFQRTLLSVFTGRPYRVNLAVSLSGKSTNKEKREHLRILAAVIRRSSLQ